MNRSLCTLTKHGRSPRANEISQWYAAVLRKVYDANVPSLTACQIIASKHPRIIDFIPHVLVLEIEHTSKFHAEEFLRIYQLCDSVKTVRDFYVLWVVTFPTPYAHTCSGHSGTR